MGAYTNYVLSQFGVEWGGGSCQMSTLYYNPYLVKVATKGKGESKISKKWLSSLCVTPITF